MTGIRLVERPRHIELRLTDSELSLLIEEIARAEASRLAEAESITTGDWTDPARRSGFLRDVRAELERQR